MADALKQQVGSGVVALVARDGGRASLVVAVTADLTPRFDAVALVRAGSRGARRPGRRRPARHGAGRRPRRGQGARGAEGDRGGTGGRQMRMAVLLAAAALTAAAAVTSACAPKTFSMEGKDADQMTKDEAQCRAQVRDVAQRNCNIDDQRRSVFEGERERFGQQEPTPPWTTRVTTTTSTA